jgi:hypothetical protein
VGEAEGAPESADGAAVVVVVMLHSYHYARICATLAHQEATMARRLTPEDLALTAAEKRAAQVQAEGGARNRAIGSAIGNVAGAGLGALGFLVPGAGAVLGPAAMAAGSQLGGALGGMAGDAFSEDELEEADEAIAEGEMKRREKVERYKLRQDALNALLSED